jgi:hypothetical protein
MTHPYTPSTATKFGWSYISTWAECETRWWNSYLRRHPKAPPGVLGLDRRYVSGALLLGSAVHRGLEEWYLSGWEGEKDTGIRDLGKAITAAVSHIHGSAGRFRAAEDMEKTEAETRSLLQGYHTTYHDETLRVAAGPNGEPLVEQEFQLDLGGGHLFTSRLDTVVFDTMEDPMGLWVLEHKTTDVSKARSLVEAFYVDGQVTGQQLQMEAHWGDRVRGVRGNFLVKRAKNVKPYQRHDYHRGQAQLEKFHMDARRRLARIEEAQLNYERLTTAGLSPDEAARVSFDASQAGSRTCINCDFMQLCKNRAQSDMLVEIDYTPKEPR